MGNRRRVAVRLGAAGRWRFDRCDQAGGRPWASTGSTPRLPTGSADRSLSSDRRCADIPAAERPYVFTKCSLVWDDTGTVTHSLRPESIRQECEASLTAARGRAHRPLPDPLAEVAKRARRSRCRAPGRCMAGDERPAPRGQGGVPRCVELRCRPARARACDRAGHEPAAALLPAPARHRAPGAPVVPRARCRRDRVLADAVGIAVGQDDA